MGEYITKKEDMKFQSQEALVPVQNVKIGRASCRERV